MLTTRWRVIHHSECSAHCGTGMRNVSKQCEQETLQHAPSAIVPVDDRHCHHLNDAPADTEPCTGPCHSVHWQFHPWSQVSWHWLMTQPNKLNAFTQVYFFFNFGMGDAQCSVTCGGGVQTRKAHCVDLNGRVIHDSNCPPEEKILRQSCHMESCPRWEVGEWTPVNQSLYQIKCSF